jgi:competence protein ComFC
MTFKPGIRKPGYWIYRMLWAATDWVYPPVCGGCLRIGERWCQSCQAQVERLEGELCPLCGIPQAGGEICTNCLVSRPPFTAVRSWGIYTGALREAIHRLKYNHDFGIAEALSRHLIELFNITGWTADLVTVVPLGPRRQQERGYNQSSFLARPLSLATGISFQPGALVRIRETRSQVGLSAQDRHENMKDAFLAKADRVKHKRVLLIDDVATTGSTLVSCAQALRFAGATAIYGLTLARAVLETDRIPAPAIRAGAAYHINL